ncbi:hypothetical protein Tco_0549159 [Tanacetum coccineum]
MIGHFARSYYGSHNSPFTTIHPAGQLNSEEPMVCYKPWRDSKVKWDEISMDFVHWFAYYSEKYLIPDLGVEIVEPQMGTPTSIGWGFRQRSEDFTSPFLKGLQKAGALVLKFIQSFHPSNRGQSREVPSDFGRYVEACALGMDQ